MVQAEASEETKTKVRQHKNFRMERTRSHGISIGSRDGHNDVGCNGGDAAAAEAADEQ